VLRAVPLCRDRATLGPERGGWRVLRLHLGDQVASDGERGPEVFPASCCSVLREWRGRFENQIGLFD
jgi:hypothetical protein